MFSARLLQAITSVNLILTPDDISAQQWRNIARAYHHSSLQEVPILSLEEWIYKNRKKIQLRFPNNITLLTTNQARAVWHDIVNQDQTVAWATSVLASDAWSFYKTWDIAIHDPLFKNISTTTWTTWAERFTAYCQQHQYIDMDTWIQTVTPNMDDPPIKIGLLGFEILPPSYKKFFTLLSKAGYYIKKLAFKANSFSSLSVRALSFKDANEEMTKMAQWSVTERMHHPKHTVVCMLPNLSGQRQTLLITYQRVKNTLHQETMHSDYPVSLPFESCALTSDPMIQIAVEILKLSFPVTIHQVTLLLFSPYLEGAVFERFPRAQFADALRQQDNPLLSNEELMSYQTTYDCTCFWNSLKTFANHTVCPTQLLSPKAWATHWKARLKTWGWPNLQSHDSKATYYYEQWLTILDAFSSLEDILPNMDDSTALHLLCELLKEKKVPFDPFPSPHKVHVMDNQQNTVGYGDTRWMINRLVEKSSYDTNPFIPYAFKKQLTTSSKSNPLPEGTPLILSDITTPIPHHRSVESITLTELELNDPSSLLSNVHAKVEWETVEDQWAFPIAGAPFTIGGTDLIKKQAICPFRAFSDYRLSLKGRFTSNPAVAPSYAEKSKALHSILQSIWQQLKDQNALNNLSEENLNQILDQTITKELEMLSTQTPYLWQPNFTRLEKKRLFQLLTKWFAVEKERPPFSIQALEQESTITIGPLRLNLTIDRIDQLPDGHLLIIDYKSSLQPLKRQGWFSNRPTDPQLPIYALSLFSEVKGVAWAHLQLAYGGKFIGIGEKDFGIPGMYSSITKKNTLPWDIALAQWRETITALAKEFSQGYAAVSPKEGEVSCQYCPYSLLCRIKELNS